MQLAQSVHRVAGKVPGGAQQSAVFSAGQKDVRLVVLWGETGLGLLLEGARVNCEMCLTVRTEV